MKDLRLLRPLGQSITSARNATKPFNLPSTLRNARLQSTNATPKKPEGSLSWNEYLSVRRSRRKWQNLMTVPTAMLGFGGGVSYFGSVDMPDPSQVIFGMDPFFFYGLCTAGCMGVGALIGPSLGTLLWRAANKKAMGHFDALDKQFYKHITRNRVDASLQSPTAPVPDYYGEKIGNLKQYRRWLRDQGKYRRKALFAET